MLMARRAASMAIDRRFMIRKIRRKIAAAFAGSTRVKTGEPEAVRVL